MQELIRVINSGWPDTRQNCPKSVMDYYNHRDELSCANDIVFKGQKLVIPASMGEEMIKAVHIGHLGVEKSVGRARDIMFWPLMSKQITDYMLGCTICLKYRDSNPNEPLHSHDVPDRPGKTYHQMCLHGTTRITWYWLIHTAGILKLITCPTQKA